MALPRPYLADCVLGGLVAICALSGKCCLNCPCLVAQAGQWDRSRGLTTIDKYVWYIETLMGPHVQILF